MGSFGVTMLEPVAKRTTVAIPSTKSNVPTAPAVHATRLVARGDRASSHVMANPQSPTEK
jgi:hypothetical protein